MRAGPFAALGRVPCAAARCAARVAAPAARASRAASLVRPAYTYGLAGLCALPLRASSKRLARAVVCCSPVGAGGDDTQKPTPGAAEGRTQRSRPSRRAMATGTEADTQTILVDHLQNTGWRDETKKTAEQCFRLNISLANTKYSGLIKGKSSTGNAEQSSVEGRPDAVIFAKLEPGQELRDRDILALVELKRDVKDISEALKDLDIYCKALLKQREDGPSLQRVLGIAMAGTDKDDIVIRVVKHDLGIKNGEQQLVKYGANAKEVDWFPYPEDMERWMQGDTSEPAQRSLPSPQRLSDLASTFNERLASASVTDSLRPAIVGALMLALWHVKQTQKPGEVLLRRHESQVIDDAMHCCRVACGNASDRHQEMMGMTLANNLALLKTNVNGAKAVQFILYQLGALGVGRSGMSADFLGQLYEEFFRYTGANTIGQYFTPRWVTNMMARIARVTLADVVLDPTCGTGGFLIAAAYEAQRSSKEPITWQQTIDQVKNNLLGFESNLLTTALCVVNMVMRGDGKSGIHNGSCFTDKHFSLETADVALMNPPFPHGHGADRIEVRRFIDRGLAGLKDRGRLAVIVPDSLLFSRKDAQWREEFCRLNTLKAVIKLPDLTFNPGATINCSIIFVEKGQKQLGSTIFIDPGEAGLKLVKNVLCDAQPGEHGGPGSIEKAVNEIVKIVHDFPGYLCDSSRSMLAASVQAGMLDAADWSVGHNIPWEPPTEAAVFSAADKMAASWIGAGFNMRLPVDAQRDSIDKDKTAEELDPTVFFAAKLADAEELQEAASEDTLGSACLAFVPKRTVINKLPAGSQLLVSGSKFNNGYQQETYELPQLLKPPFITVTHRGGPGLAFVHTVPCLVTDTCLVLVLNKRDTRAEEEKLADMFLLGALITCNAWRFNYSRACMFERIADLPLSVKQPDGSTVKLRDINPVQRRKFVADVKQLGDALKTAFRDEPGDV